MATVGDLVAYLSMDNSRFQSGAMQAQATARQTGTVIQSALNPRTLQQGGFALQDFFSVLNQGGANAAARAFGGITNNLAMLGAGFGPVGMAVTSIGAGLATVLIPQLMAGTEESNRFSDAMERMAHATDVQTAAYERQASMRAKLREFTKEQDFDGNREQGVKKEALRAQDELESIEKQIEARSRQLRGSMNQANLAAQEAGDKPAVIGGVNAFSQDGRLKEGATLQVSDKYFEAFTKQRDAIVDLYQKERELKEFRQQLDSTQPKAREMDMADEAAKREKQHFDEMIKMRQKLEDDAKTDDQKRMERLNEIKMLFSEGFVDSNTAAAAMAKLEKPIAQSRSSQEALIAGSSGAISQIVKAESGREMEQQQLRLSQQLVDNAKQQLDEIKRLNQNAMTPVVIGQ